MTTIPFILPVDRLRETATLLAFCHPTPAYRLIVNGGEYQDFPYLHFHLVSS